MEKRLDKFETDMKWHINSSISSLRTDMNTEFTRVDDQIRQMQEHIKLLKSAPSRPQILIYHGLNWIQAVIYASRTL